MDDRWLMVGKLSTLLIGKSPIIGGAFSSFFGLGAEATGLLGENGNKALIVILCGLAGTILASIFRGGALLIAARANARLTDNELILAIHTRFRHDLQEGLNAAVLHAQLRGELLREANIHFPEFTPIDVDELIKELDAETLAIRKRKTPPVDH